ncbi:MAG: uncharacterized protein QG664_624 [Patescibacteria group bacterium]|nr:uncharacterized protein [Patescibacteria group bacterium]
MKIQDRVYGSIVFDEPVLIELIESPTLQRLRGVDMGGYYEVYFPGSKHSRFEHSLGVAWLLRRFGASLEEQVAGLLHDASHSAFSHAIDYAIASADQATQSYQDDVHESYLEKTEVPASVAKYGFLMEHVLDDARHPLKEWDLPDLCADRIDYILRGGIAYRVISSLQAQVFLDALGVRDNRWVFRDAVIAREFAELFRYVNHTFYSNIETALMFRTTGDWLAYALAQGYVSLPELYTTDEEVIGKVNAYLETDHELQKFWKRMNRETGYRLDPDGSERKTLCKSRMVDPLCLEAGEIRRLSEIDPAWGEVVRIESKPKEYTIVFEDVSEFPSGEIDRAADRCTF